MASKNRLVDETSPYLQQHADNPVDWFSWGEEALAAARDANKPILLSIGYSACHWCHVMAHESFEDEQTAAVMNELFINIKVDREERPDLDKIYQNAHYLLTQRGGGWPLTVFLTPDDQVPFFAGTYFPPEPRHGLLGFAEVCRRIASAFQEKEAEIRDQNQKVLDALAVMEQHRSGDAGVEPDSGPLLKARDELLSQFDSTYGGFGQAPKFPHPSSLDFLLRTWATAQAGGEADEQALHACSLTLRRMALGGIYDQLGGGFARYSVDERWSVPHFEKMLYDNGPLLALYAQAWAATSERLFHDVAVETGQWIMDEMQSPGGGYYSALDADSEGVEGRFYAWDRSEVEALLDADEFAVVAARYGLNDEPNFEGLWHLNVHLSVERIAKQLKLEEEDVGARLGSAHDKLFGQREQRVKPGRDEKTLVSWNALTVRGMAIAGRHLGRWEFIASADRALAFIRASMWKDGRLFATYKDDRAHLSAYLDDYAFLIDALLEYLQADWRSEYVEWACELADVLITHFEDSENGGFFFTADDHEALIHRSKPLGDDATPSGNGVAVHTLMRLGYLAGESRYIDSALQAVRAAWGVLESAPSMHSSLLIGLQSVLSAEQIIVIRGEVEEMDDWLERTDRAYAPARYVVGVPTGVAGLPDFLSAKKAPDSGVMAYVCRGTRCKAPISNLNELRPLLNAGEAVYTPRQAGA